MHVLRISLLAALVTACGPKTASVLPDERAPKRSEPPPSKGWVDAQPAVVDDAPTHEPEIKSSIRRVVRRNMSSIRGCYNPLLARDPALSGTVTVRFTIVAEGAVEAAMVENSTVRSEALERCVVDVFSTMTFPSLGEDGEHAVSYPIVFVTARSVDTSHPAYMPAAGLVFSVLRPKIDACFDKRGRKREVVFVDFRVDEAGQPSGVGVDGLPPASLGLRRCVVRAVLATTMPKPKRVAPVDVTLEL